MHSDTRAAVLAAIRAEVATDPASRGYASKTAAEIVALMNAPVVIAQAPHHRDVSISDVEGYLRARFLVTQLRAWAAAAARGTAKMAADELLDIIASPRLSMFTTSTDTGRANVLGLFAALVAATGGIVTQTHLDELTAMTLAPAGLPVTEPPRWVAVIDGISAAPTPGEPIGQTDDGKPIPHPGYAGPPNAATEALIEEARGNGW